MNIQHIIAEAIREAVTQEVANVIRSDSFTALVETLVIRQMGAQAAPNLGQLRAQFAEDINTLAATVDLVKRNQEHMIGTLNGASARFIRIEETLSGMQERFALKEVVEDDIGTLKTAMDDRDQDIQDLRNAFRKFKDNGPELDSQEVADVIADLFSDGTLTITIDKV